MSLPVDADCHAPPAPRIRAGTPRVVVAGNPNAGKSTLFNALTRGQAQVGNFSGTTVSTLSGTLELPGIGEVELVDLPGTYSLAAASPDERVAIDAILGTGGLPAPDLLLVVVDGPRLLRSLYLVLQALELGVPTVLAVNLMDEARAGGVPPDLEELARLLGVPVVGTVARSREGLDELRAALARGLERGEAPRSPIHWSEALQRDAAEVARELPEALRAVADGTERALALGRWALLSADAEGRLPGADAPTPSIVSVRQRARAGGRDLEAELVGARYAWLDAREVQLLGREGARPDQGLTERLDRVLLHPLFGSFAFVGVMALAFTALFSWADPLVGLVESAMGALGEWVGQGMDAGIAALPATLAGPLGLLRDLVVEGLIGGVGAVLVFLPQIGLLFLLLALLEDCGYLARAAHLADRVLRAAGLPGRAFVPLLSGYACAVPAILATRTLPRFRDRLLTMLVIPLTSCSARLPIYTLLIAALFPATVAGWVPVRPLMLVAMYLFSTGAAVLASIVLGRTAFAQTSDPVLLELPPYRLPDPRVVFGVVVSRCTDFVREAGGVILIATVVLWALLTFPRHDPEELLAPEVVAAAVARGDDLEPLAAEAALEHSFAGMLGKAIEPAIRPLGYDWRIGIGILGAFAAREVFVSTLGVVYGVGDEVDEESVALRDRIRGSTRADGRPTYTPLVGLSIMVFFALSLQCLSTLAVLRKESGSWVWPAAAFTWMSVLAWVSAFAVYQGGRLLGFS